MNDITTGSVKHCPDNSTSVDDASCVELDLDDINCTFGASSTTCEIPVNVGFSVFVVEDAYVAPAEESSSSSGGSGGGASSADITTNETNSSNEASSVSDDIVGSDETSASHDISSQDYEVVITLETPVAFDFKGEAHSVELNSFNENQINITVRSEPINAVVLIGATEEFDINNDGSKDISITYLESGVNPKIKIVNISRGVNFGLIIGALIICALIIAGLLVFFLSRKKGK